MQYVQLSPEAARRLSELAKRTGRRPIELIEEGIEDLENRYSAQVGDEVSLSRESQKACRKDSQTRVSAWLEAVKTFPPTPPLSDEAISRESIYGDRG